MFVKSTALQIWTLKFPHNFSCHLFYAFPGGETPKSKSAGSFTCVIWGLCNYNLSSDLKRGKRARWQVNLSSQLVKLTSLSSESCHLRKKICRQIFFWESLSRRRRCLRDFSVLSLRVVVCLKKRIFGWTRCEYHRDITPRPHLFHGTNSHEATQLVHRKLGWTKRVKDSVIHVAERLTEVST